MKKTAAPTRAANKARKSGATTRTRRHAKAAADISETAASLPVVAPSLVKELSQDEANLLDPFLKSNAGKAMRPLPSFVSDSSVNGVPELKRDPKVDEQLWRAQVATVVGSTQRAVQRQIMTDLYAICGKHVTDPAAKMSEALGLMVEIEPKDAVEARLAAQMVTSHTVAMDLLQKGLRGGDSILVRDFYLRHAERLMRLFGHQVESLSRYRGKAPSEQRVTVEHVHVYEGGQAVVGNVSHPPIEAGRGGERVD